jgi:GntR family transcriptional regulator
VDELDIAIDRTGSEPASAQLKGSLRRLIDAGGLAPGERIPTVRAFAVRLGVAPNTVARAYRELEAERYLVGRGRAGTFVSDMPPAPAVGPGLVDLASAYLLRARAAGATTADAVEAARQAAADVPD